MITGYIVGLFILAGVSMYALIQSKTNRWLVFILIPIILCMSLYTWQAVTMLQGKPIAGLPEDKEVEILYITVRKPDIYLLMKHSDQEQPTYYFVPWTKENAKKLQQLKRLQAGGIDLQGKFTKKRNSNNSESRSLEWQQTLSYQQQNPKNN